MIYYKFKNVKHSVIMVFVMMNKDGEWILENKDYKGLLYTTKPEDLEVVYESTN